MLLQNFNNKLEIGTKIANIMGWDETTLTIDISNHEIILYNKINDSASYSTITIAKNDTTKNKILNVEVAYSSNGRYYDKCDSIYKYRRKPSFYEEDTKFIPSKEKLFHHSLDFDIMTNQEELYEMMKLMDEYEGIIKITVLLANKLPR